MKRKVGTRASPVAKPGSPTPSQSLWRLRVAVRSDCEDAVSCLLESEFGQPVSIQVDVQKDRSWATVYLSKRSDWSVTRKARIHARLRDLAECGIEVPRIHVSAARVAREDWAESWKRHFKPLAIGRHLLVLPSWSRRQPRRGQAVVILDPGLSFGTGNHPTTRFCLEELARARTTHGKRSLLDVGCGSGILAICAVKLGYDIVEAFDFDPAAVRVAAANAEQNQVRSRLKLNQADLNDLPLRPIKTYDVVCANLTADLLVGHTRKLARLVALDGRLALAGILATQFTEVRAAFAKEGFRMIRSRAQGEWRSGAFRRSSGL